MIDIFIVVGLMFAIAFAMRKHDHNFKVGKGLGDFLAWFMVSFFLLALIRLPIYLMWIGARFPFNPTDTQQIVSGVTAIAFWWAMIYWRIPMRLLGRKNSNG